MRRTCCRRSGWTLPRQLKRCLVRRCPWPSRGRRFAGVADVGSDSTRRRRLGHRFQVPQSDCRAVLQTATSMLAQNNSAGAGQSRRPTRPPRLPDTGRYRSGPLCATLGDATDRAQARMECVRRQSHRLVNQPFAGPPRSLRHRRTRSEPATRFRLAHRKASAAATPSCLARNGPVSYVPTPTRQGDHDLVLRA